MRLSILDGVFAVPYITLTTGVILTGFLMALGATEFQIGLIAMFPLLAGLLQPLGAEIVRRTGGWRKPVVLAAVLTDSTLWAVSLAAVLLFELRTAVLVVTAVIFFQQIATSFTAVSWTSWMTDLVPPGIRGRYFGRRNFLCNLAGVVTAVAAGQFIDRVGDDAVWSYLVLIAVGMCFRYASAYFLRRQPEPVPSHSAPGRFFDQLAQPLKEPNFRSFLLFTMVWGFAVNLTAPFFTVYMVRTLELSFGLVAFLAACATGVNLVGQRFWGPLCDRYGNLQIMRATALTICLQPFWWIFTSGEGWGLYLLVALNVSGAFAWSGQLMASTNLMMRIAPQVGRTSFFAVQGALGGAAGAMGPLIGGLLAGYLMAQPEVLGAALLEGLKALFVLSTVLRLGAWAGLLRRVTEPVEKPKFNMVLILRDSARTFNIQQGFSPLFHVFTTARDRYLPHLKKNEFEKNDR